VRQDPHLKGKVTYERLIYTEKAKALLWLCKGGGGRPPNERCWGEGSRREYV